MKVRIKKQGREETKMGFYARSAHVQSTHQIATLILGTRCRCKRMVGWGKALLIRRD
jgi:hypothetical protein